MKSTNTVSTRKSAFPHYPEYNLVDAVLEVLRKSRKPRTLAEVCDALEITGDARKFVASTLLRLCTSGRAERDVTTNRHGNDVYTYEFARE